LLELDVLMRNGEMYGADVLRDKMNKPWYNLSHMEQRVMDQVSQLLLDGGSITWDEVLVMTVMVI
jgi:hypothetical protein